MHYLLLPSFQNHSLSEAVRLLITEQGGGSGAGRDHVWCLFPELDSDVQSLKISKGLVEEPTVCVEPSVVLAYL